MVIRTRFAPSPTGALHIGSARTALFSWLLARRHQGLFFIRIEDTDKLRTTKDSLESIKRGLEWLELDVDGNFVYQSERSDIYRAAIQTLLDSGHAYRCVCTQERLAELRARQMSLKQKPRYDGRCRELGIAEDCRQPHVVRFRNPADGDIIYDDLVHGSITVANKELDDFVVARTDGSATYNLTVVVDDIQMELTHVIRGDDHISNTPRQLNLFYALGVTPPQYAHIPLILGADGQRLSKRHGACSVMAYRDQGILADAMINSLARLGWAKGDQEIIGRQELIKCFDLKDVNKSAAVFDAKKLYWLNQQYMKSCDVVKLSESLKPFLQKLEVTVGESPELTDIVSLQRDRSKTLQEMALNSQFFYYDNLQYDPDAVKKMFIPKNINSLNVVMEQLQMLHNWDSISIHEVIEQCADSLGVKFGNIAQLMRVAVTGGLASPPIDDTLRVLGKENTIKRLSAAKQLCEK